MSMADKLSSDRKFQLVIEALAGKEFIPLTLKEVTTATGMEKATVHAKLKEGIKFDWVEKEGDRYHLGPALLSIAFKLMTGAQNHITATHDKFKQLTGENNDS